MEPLSGHVDTITNTPLPSTPKELQRFLGMIKFYFRFLLVAANILRPLTEALKGNPKVLSWTAEMQAATDNIKAALVAPVPLSHSLPAAQVSLATDASDSRISGVLQKREAGAWWPLGFYSRKLSETECGYSAFDRELLPSAPLGILGSCWRAAIFSSGPTTSQPGCPAPCLTAMDTQAAVPAGVYW